MMNFLILMAGMSLGFILGTFTVAFLYSISQRIKDLQADSGVMFTADFDSFEPPLKLIRDEDE